MIWWRADGADTIRAYLMFIGPWELGGPWNSKGIEGVARFMNDVWNLVVDDGGRAGDSSSGEADVRDLRRAVHQTIRDATGDIETFKFNTVVAKLMGLRNALKAARGTGIYGTAAWDEGIDSLLLLLAPIAPHISEELWQRRHPGASVHVQRWPVWDADAAKDDVVTLVVQVNGKVRGKIEVPAGVRRGRGARAGSGRPQCPAPHRRQDRAQGDFCGGVAGECGGGLMR
ncbi:MAG: class I tRNA ligase family protein [Anaerolineae bacterium]